MSNNGRILGWRRNGRMFVVDAPPYTTIGELIAAPVLAYKEVV
jgi:hypothetical protein